MTTTTKNNLENSNYPSHITRKKSSIVGYSCIASDAILHHHPDHTSHLTCLLGYGMTELTGASHICPATGSEKQGSAGPMLPNQESKVSGQKWLSILSRTTLVFKTLFAEHHLCTMYIFGSFAFCF